MANDSIDRKNIEYVSVDNPNKISMNKRIVAGGVGLAVGAAIGLVGFGIEHRKFYKKEIIIISALVGGAVFLASYLTNPNKIHVEAKQ